MDKPIWDFVNNLKSLQRESSHTKNILLIIDLIKKIFKVCSSGSDQIPIKKIMNSEPHLFKHFNLPKKCFLIFFTDFFR